MRSLIAVLASAAFVTAASAGPVYSFYKLTNNGNVDVGSQLAVEVNPAGPGQVSFTFTNNVGIASSITDVYFDDGTLLGIATVTYSAGVNFSQGASPGNLPGGNLATPAFVTTAGFSADSNPPTEANGVDAANEWLTITFNLINGKTFNDTIAALASGELRIGLHVQAIGQTGGSDSYINNPNPIPLPGAALLGALGLAVAGWAKRRMA